MIEAVLYFAVLCLVYQSSEFATQIWLSSDYWFLAGWIIGIVVAMFYKEFIHSPSHKDL